MTRSAPNLMRRCTLCHGPGALVALTLCGGVSAQEATYVPAIEHAPAFRSPERYLQVHTGLTYTDNVMQIPRNTRGEMLASAGFDVDYTHKSARFDFDSRGAVNWIEYLKNTYSGLASGALNAKALLGNSSDLLQWGAWETFGQLDTDPLAAPTPVNIENVNYFTTGPILNFGLGRSNRVSFRGLYSISTYQKSPYDSNSYDVGASLSHAVSAFSSLDFDIDSRRRQFRDPLAASDYEVRSAFAGYTSSIARTRLSAEVGYSMLKYRGRNSGSPLLSLGLERRISPSSTISLEGQVGYTADSESIRAAAGLVAPSGPFTAASSPNPLKLEAVSLGWDFVRARTMVSIFSAVTRQRYELEALLDQKDITLQLVALRRLSPTLSATLSVQRETQKYSSLGADVAETTLLAGFSKTFTRVGVSLLYQMLRRTGSSSSNAILGVYNENRVGLYVTYDLLGHHLTPTGVLERRRAD